MQILTSLSAKLLSLAGLYFCLLSPVMALPAVSEKIIFLNEDGKHYVRYDTTRTDHPDYDIWFKKENIQQPEQHLKDFLYLYPNEHQWDTTTQPNYDLMKIPSGNHATLVQGELDSSSEISIGNDGVYTYTNWDGKTQTPDNHYGIWNKPDNFSQMVYAWVFPRNFNIISYQANRKGNWVKRNNTITYYGNDVNDLVFTIKYQPRSNPVYQELVKALKQQKSDQNLNQLQYKDQGQDHAQNLSQDRVQNQSHVQEQGQDTTQNQVHVQDQSQVQDRDQDQVQLEQDSKSVRITMAATLLFSSGSSKLRNRGKSVLRRLSKALSSRNDLHIIIEGHSDNISIKGKLAKKHKSNWELSAARSLTVLHYLAEHKVSESQLEARAHGSNRPIASNETRQGRAKNRRIEIVVMRAKK